MAIAPPALSALRLSLSPTLNLLSPSNVHKVSTFAHSQTSLSLIFRPSSLHSPSLSVKWVLQRMVGNPCPKGTASFSAESSSGDGREILVQHLLVKEDNLKLLVDLQQRVSGGEDLSDLAAEYSICPSKQEGECSLGEEGANGKNQYSKTFNLRSFHVKMQDPSFLDEAQLIDVREPEEVAQASLLGFQVLPLRKFGSWGPEITTKFNPQKDTYVMCHHGVRSLQVAKWLQTQGFKRVFNVSGGIHGYAQRVDPTIPTY
ncbi:rhodanese-like domain-containing protein / PPIC-type PPIASE domain-containing protein [Prunus dulcis]|uniref:Peptidyl-prolyl cis-trans isomerase n=1 Tax=Prunus dulcis TaxID=3755 RepID=A0A4Y1REC4_PRUDU|nr:rhodanese-like domain-containing protein / PPIC-type PPIASE domain-containing protein [Prunus dulcis]